MHSIKTLILPLFVLAFFAHCKSKDYSTLASVKSQTDAALPQAALEDSQGGMWMPSQLPALKESLTSKGLKIPVDELKSPLEAPLNAIVSLGGCTASFVSPDGLIITNHHCVRSSLQYHSTAEENLLEDGFLAKTRQDEKWNGPAARVWIHTSQTDITESILKGVKDIEEPAKRFDTIESRKKTAISSCEKETASTRCVVKKYFDGAEYHLLKLLEIKDVRLVYAPHRSVGNYGGEIDNWMWPRHTGDFSFYRAYVGKDGKPAPYSKDNVPYKPTNHLKVAKAPLAPGDFVMVAGYPGSTHRLATAHEVGESLEYGYPTRLAKYEALLAELDGLKSEDAKLKSQSLRGGISNYFKKTKGLVKGLNDGGLVQKKVDLEQSLQAWIDKDTSRKNEYGQVLKDMKKINLEAKTYREYDDAMGGLFWSNMLSNAMTIVRLAEEKQKPDTERDIRYQERNWERLVNSSDALEKKYNGELDKTLLDFNLERLAKEPKAKAEFETLSGIKLTDANAIDKATTALFKHTKLNHAKVRKNYLEKSTVKSLSKDKDPFIQLALKMLPTIKKMEEREEKWEGELALLKPVYLKALREQSPTPIAPDANSSLRVTYGNIKGYRPRGEDFQYVPFTKLSEVVSKHSGKEPFDAPSALLATAKKKDFGSFAHPELNDVPVNFLADLDITNGNSGSPTLNANGELVGVVFDGNLDSVASEWLYMPDITRSIHCDIRYVLWIMSKVDKADHLIKEMGVDW